MKRRHVIRLSFAVLIAAAAAAFFAAGPENVWRATSGNPDLGTVDFDNLPPVEKRNQFLMCSEQLCTGQVPNRLAPEFDLPADRLRALSREVWQALPDVTLVAGDDQAMQDRYVQRTRFLRFPDTITVRFYPLPEGRSTIAILSRSQIGYFDFGSNGERVKTWVLLLDEAARQQKAQ